MVFYVLLASKRKSNIAPTIFKKRPITLLFLPECTKKNGFRSWFEMFNMIDSKLYFVYCENFKFFSDDTYHHFLKQKLGPWRVTKQILLYQLPFSRPNLSWSIKLTIPFRFLSWSLSMIGIHSKQTLKKPIRLRNY